MNIIEYAPTTYKYQVHTLLWTGPVRSPPTIYDLPKVQGSPRDTFRRLWSCTIGQNWISRRDPYTSLRYFKVVYNLYFPAIESFCRVHLHRHFN